jgi:hypothetical protein
MGSLKPGATYIYERHKGTTYAREFGADPNTRTAIGWDYNPAGDSFTKWQDNRSAGQQELDAHNEWIKIRLAGKSNPALQKAIENVTILYRMTKDDK